MSKRILSLVLAMVMVLGTFGTMVFAETSHGEKIDWLLEQGMVQGNESGDLMLEALIDRASTARMIAVALDKEAEAAGLKGLSSGFKDMTPAHWANGYANLAAGMNLIVGDQNGNFMPGKDITYGEVAAVLVRLSLGRDLTAEERGAAGSWVAPYVAKASELGILDDVSVVSFEAKAVRKDVLEMFYNAMVNMEVGNYTVVKAIVLENNRVEAIGKDEVVVEIIRELQRANYVEDSRYERGDQENFVIDAKVGNVENLLGKVADFTLNKDGKVVKVTVDETYKVIEGPLTATKNKVEMDKNYTVELPERYDDKDERIFRTYHNDKAYDYEEFYREVEEADYARVTVKNGKVLFIDAFTFEDIAPVQEVKKDGDEVYVYNDQRDARVEKYAPATVIGYTEEDGFVRMEKEDIQPNDVVHVYTVGRDKNMIVRQDALVEGTFERVSEGSIRGNFYVNVDGEAYLMNTADYKKPVYSFDSKEFKTLYARDASRDLNGFRNEDVTVLKDIRGHLQYIGAGIEFHEGIAMIDQILSRGTVRYVNPSNEKFELAETFDTFLRILGSTTNQRMNAFGKGDLTFVVNDEEDIDTMIRLATANQIDTNAKLVRKAAGATKFEMNSDYIRLDDGTKYNLLNKTNVFVLSFATNGSVSGMRGTTILDVRSGARANTDLRAYVLTDKEFDRVLDLSDRNRTSGRDDVAHTIVFVDYTGADASLDYETIRVTRLSSANVTNRWIEGVTADGTPVDRTIDRYTNMSGAQVGDIVELGLSKDDDKIVMDIDRLIPYNAGTFKVVDMDSRTDYRWIELQDAAGTKLEFWVSNSVKEFGYVATNDVVSYSQNTANDINAIRSFGRNERVTGLFTGSTIPGDTTTGVININTVTKVIVVETDAYTYDNTTVLTNEKGTIIAVGETQLEAALANGDQVRVEKVENGTIKRMVAINVASETLAATTVVNQIKALDEEEATFATDVSSARSAYAGLTQSQQDLVTNLADLVNAENKVAAMVVDAAIEGLAMTVDTITLADKATVDGVKSQYDALTPAQRALVKVANVNELNALLAKLVTLTPASATLTPSVTNVTLTELTADEDIDMTVVVKSSTGVTLDATAAAGTFALSTIPTGAASGTDYNFNSTTGELTIISTSGITGPYTVTYTNTAVNTVTATATVTVK